MFVENVLVAVPAQEATGDVDAASRPSNVAAGDDLRDAVAVEVGRVLQPRAPVLVAAVDEAMVVSQRRGGEEQEEDDGGARHYDAPRPDNTAGIVRSRIFRSSDGDQLSMYCRSSCIQWSKSILLRPDT